MIKDGTRLYKKLVRTIGCVFLFTQSANVTERKCRTKGKALFSAVIRNKVGKGPEIVGKRVGLMYSDLSLLQFTRKRYAGDVNY